VLVQAVGPHLEVLAVHVEDPLAELVHRALESIICQTRCDGSKLRPKLSSGIAVNISRQIAGA
jgi:hypothetical protein